MKALARLVGPMPGQDHPIELHNLLLEGEQLGTQRGKAGASNLRYPLVVRVSNNAQEFRGPFAPDRRDNAELGEVRSDRIDQCGLVADEHMASAVKHQATLLLRRFSGHEPHVSPGDRLTNRLSVRHVVLLSFDVGLHVSWRHQSYGMAKCLQLARPMVRRGASLDANQAWRQLLKERQHVATLQLAANYYPTNGINSVDLED
jgi:hypothetical protein